MPRAVYNEQNDYDWFRLISDAGLLHDDLFNLTLLFETQKNDTVSIKMQVHKACEQF